jgi:polyisoprenyl-phosphate glycosyltransferase
MPVTPKLSVVVPCFNEAECLHELHRRVSLACLEAVGDDYELVLVNDASTDESWRHMRAMALVDRHVVCLDLARNHGHQLALTAGLSACRGDHILIIDADLQDPPELLGPMLEAMERNDADVVYGERRSRAGETWIKRASAALFYRFLRRLTEVDIPADTGDFRLMRRRALDVLQDMPEQHRFIRGMVAWVGMRQIAFPYDRHSRHAGVTKYPLRKMLRLTADAVTGFSTAPLRLATYIGFLLAMSSAGLLAYVLSSWAVGRTVPGWTSLMGVMLFVSSVQMLLLGVMGEYVGRLYMESKRRPLFVVRETVGRVATDARAVCAAEAA